MVQVRVWGDAAVMPEAGSPAGVATSEQQQGRGQTTAMRVHRGRAGLAKGPVWLWVDCGRSECASAGTVAVRARAQSHASAAAVP